MRERDREMALFIARVGLDRDNPQDVGLRLLGVLIYKC